MSFSLPRISHASNGRQQKVKDELEKRREEHSVDEEGYCVFRRRPSIFVESHENEEPMTLLIHQCSILYLVGRREGERRRVEV